MLFYVECTWGACEPRVYDPWIFASYVSKRIWYTERPAARVILTSMRQNFDKTSKDFTFADRVQSHAFINAGIDWERVNRKSSDLRMLILKFAIFILSNKIFNFLTRSRVT